MARAQHTTIYVEIAVSDLARAKLFYAAAFGWEFNDYGPVYAGIRSADGSSEIGGLTGGGTGGTIGPLILLESDDVDASTSAVVTAGGILDGEIYAYPGGRRFTFTDPDGNRLGVFQPGH